MSTGIGIRASAATAWIALHKAIAEYGPTPCEADPDRWAEPVTDAVAQWASFQCQRCPVIALCNDFAVNNSETAGIWAGRNMTPRRGRPAAEPKEQTA